MASHLTQRSRETLVTPRSGRACRTLAFAILGFGIAIFGSRISAAQPEQVSPRPERAKQPGRTTRAARARNDSDATVLAPSKRTASAAENSHPALAARLARSISIDWDQVSFRSALDDLASSGMFDLLLDRRVDPDRLFSSAIENLPIEQGLEQVANAEQLGVSQLGALVYVAPDAAAARLRTLAALRGADVERLPADARRHWLSVALWSWPRFSAPRELLERLAGDAGLQITGLEQVPHDLWPAAQLPSLSVADRLTLLANEFDLTYRLSSDGRKAELVPIPSSIQITRRYPGGSNAEQLAEQWRERAPEAKIKVQGTQLIVSGRAEDHERLRNPTTASEAPASAPQNSSDPSLVRNRLEIKSLPLGSVIEGLSQKLHLKVEMDRAAIERSGISFDQAISVDVKDATLKQVWQAVLEPVGLAFEIKGDLLRITPKAN